MPPPGSILQEQDDLFSHRSAWRAAIVEAWERNKHDSANGSYWNHELKVFDRVFGALQARLDTELAEGIA